jgi:hypothetical protein
MKRFVFFPCVFALSLILAVPVMAQKKEIPDAAKKAFAMKFPAATGIKWGSESKTEFEAEFKLNGKEMSANFDPQGKWLETESELSPKELPAAVATAVKTSNPGCAVKEAAKVETPAGTTFEVVIKMGKDGYELVLSPDGKLVKKVDLKEEKEDEEKEKQA